MNRRVHWFILAVTCGWLASFAGAQQTFEKLPEYESYQRVREASRTWAAMGRSREIEWAKDGATVAFVCGEQRVTFDLNQRKEIETKPGDEDAGDRARPQRRSRASGGNPGRGRQRDSETSPSGRWTAECRDWNVFLIDNETEQAQAITTDGWRKFRYGKASWVYGEELDQREAMWWSPDSKILVYYEFDERDVPDHWLVTGWSQSHTKAAVEGYPKPGEANPIAGFVAYDIESGERTRIDVGDDTEQYIYGARFAEAGDELLFFRTNRRQNVLELVAANVESGETRIVLTETQETWQDNRPTLRFLEDGERFIWETERTGWRHYELRNLDGSLMNQLTAGSFPCEQIIKVDEERGELWFAAFSDENALNAQVHRVSLDGKNQTKLTTRAMNYTFVDVAPGGDWFIATYEAFDTPATTVLCDRSGVEAATLCEASATAEAEANVMLPELFRCKAADDGTILYGVLYKPTDFDPQKRYPLLIDVYGGPQSQSVRNRFAGGRAECEFGWLVAEIDNRGTRNRGKAFEAAVYLKLGDVDLADQASGVKYLIERPYVDTERVGISGSSYGGYMAALGIVKYPELFSVAVAGSSVTDWRQYDSIYTERYMWIPAENEAGYDAGSCMKYAENLRGNLLLQLGLLDNNVHPNNTWQLVNSLREKGKRFEVSVYPENAHGLGMAAHVERIFYLREHFHGLVAFNEPADIEPASAESDVEAVH